MRKNPKGEREGQIVERESGRIFPFLEVEDQVGQATMSR